jgi:hypothetical protein
MNPSAPEFEWEGRSAPACLAVVSAAALDQDFFLGESMRRVRSFVEYAKAEEGCGLGRALDHRGVRQRART